ncbi:MAG: N-acetylmuramoyl-L-alanine amidase [Bacteroidia bacterium]
MKKFLLSPFLLFLLSALPAQQAQIRQQDWIVAASDCGREFSFTLPESCRAWTLRRLEGDWDSSLWLLHSGAWQKLQSDPHGPEQFAQSELVFTGGQTSINLIFSSPGQYRWFGIDPGEPEPAHALVNPMPDGIIPQSVWRAGLAAPKPNPVSTPTRHAIVHHSAGSTFDTNYTAVVRSYYLLHTEVNGWDDIGYNYLIARDGSIFAGRDPQNRTGVVQDNVRGAHFCGKNEYTMGICVIGDFTSQAPATAALYSLCDLLAWKFEKDGLDPLGSQSHPTPTDAALSRLAGHRDGCNTACPGNLLYSELFNLRQCVSRRQPLSATETALPAGWILESHGDHFRLLSSDPQPTVMEIYDTGGRLMRRANGTAAIETGALPSGLWYARICRGALCSPLKLFVP